MDALIVGRVLAGVGGNGIFLGILNHFSLLTAEHEHGRYISGMGITWGNWCCPWPCGRRGLRYICSDVAMGLVHQPCYCSYMCTSVHLLSPLGQARWRYRRALSAKPS
ncbi:hypothetical protein V1527DRAFT_311068 [Lipomyces starkeyi]